ncbi:MAG: preprotein translocase subunit SecY, partial [Bacilli bacterium]|nr:preprotein translocase subunit SecY [Bacilli bacterium]
LKEWSEEGPSGKEKINQVTKYLALFLAFVQGLAISIGVSAQYGDILFEGIGNVNAFTYVYLALIITAGTAFCLWLAEKITKRGIGNGSSLLIVAGIVASFPPMINDLIKSFISAEGAGVGDAFIFVGVILLLILIIIGIVFMEGAQRRIPIQYANRPAAASFRGKSDSNIPIKLNSASVIPVIFASTLMSIPTTIANFLDTGSRAYYWIVEIFSSTKPIGFALYIILIYAFSFFYSFLQMNPDNMAENLQKQNAYIPGIRPGDETASYISRVLFKITMVGSTYLALVAITPIIMTWIFKLPGSIQIGGTGLIIVVGVALETAKQLKTETEEKQYRGFLE